MTDIAAPVTTSESKVVANTGELWNDMQAKMNEESETNWKKRERELMEEINSREIEIKELTKQLEGMFEFSDEISSGIKEAFKGNRNLTI